ncbi:oxygen-independent coproporphyrinogen III oxidase [Halovulum sp. GXIMD14793]
MTMEKLTNAGLLDAKVPRYTSYPTADRFAPVTVMDQARWLNEVPTDQAISLYVHIPFCQRLCLFCACRTQGVNSERPVATYLEVLKTEVERVAATLPRDVTVGHLHWGGGSPNVLTAEMTRDLMGALRQHFTFTYDLHFSVEIDPVSFSQDKCDALVAAGLTRASFGIQDFDPAVQEIIGRPQSYEMTRDHVAMLRAGGVAGINVDLVYGLPHQTVGSLDQTLDRVLELQPNRIALFGYAHVPWMAPRQRVIPEAALPEASERLELFRLAAERFEAAGFLAVGIDHFVMPEDAMAKAQQAGRLRRNFQGYTDDPCKVLVGLGASAISKLPGGYVQNAPATADYMRAVRDGDLAGARGIALSLDDKITAAAIEAVMCRFEVSLRALAAQFGPEALALKSLLDQAAVLYGDFVRYDGDRLVITEEPRMLARMVAACLDAYAHDAGRYSRAV